jgi:endonuclease-3
MGEYNEYRTAWIKAESLAAKQKRAGKIYDTLTKLNPNTKTALLYKTPMQFLAAVIMSAQATDKMVNVITRDLFKKYRTPKDFAAANPKQFEQAISRIGLYRAKAKNIIAAAKVIEEKFRGKIPKTMAEIRTLPGVARKTGNIVLWEVHGVIDGIAVDTHVRRLSQRLGFTENDDPKKIERDLIKLYPDKNRWPKINTLLIDLGRPTCIAQNPRCAECPLKNLCPSSRL